MVLAGALVFQDSELETKLLGVRLPLSEKTIQDWIASARASYDNAAAQSERAQNPLTREAFLNLTRYSLNQLT